MTRKDRIYWGIMGVRWASAAVLAYLLFLALLFVGVEGSSDVDWTALSCWIVASGLVFAATFLHRRRLVTSVKKWDALMAWWRGVKDEARR